MDPAQLKKIPLFANLTADHLVKVAEIATQKQVRANEKIFQEGEVGTEMYLIGSGKVRISKMVPGVGEEALAILEQAPARIGGVEANQGTALGITDARRDVLRDHQPGLETLHHASSLIGSAAAVALPTAM